MNKLKPLAALAAVTMTLAGCSLGLDAVGGKDVSPDSEELAVFYNQDVEWYECEGGMCAEVSVPLDYADPSGDTITIALVKVPARSGESIGSLFVNPGGPGGSGKDLALNSTMMFSPAVVDSYDIIGFDPRGVGDSTAIDCVSDERLGEITDLSIDMSTSEGLAEDRALGQEIADGCSENSGELLKHVDTVSVARDLDILRALAGDEKLNYLGFSYGTSLGGQYADIFPDKVGRMVLDGAVDTSIGMAQMSYDQTIGFEIALEHYIEDCISKGDCVLGSTVEEGQKKVKSLFDEAFTKPFPTGKPKRPLTQSLLMSSVVGLLYSKQTWSTLTMAFEDLIESGDGSTFLWVSDVLQSREGDTFTDNSTEANWAINCADYVPADPDDLERYSDMLVDEAPVFGTFQTAGTDLCSLWAFNPKSDPGKFVAKGSAPIVVIGTKYDPATPYAWAEAMNDSFDNSVLITWEGEGHTAYGRNSTCVDDAVDAYLIEGKVPEDGLYCKN